MHRSTPDPVAMPAAGSPPRPNARPLRTDYVTFDDGDLDGIEVMHFEDRTRVAVFERGGVLPVLEALLTAADCQALCAALHRLPPCDAT